MNRPEFPLDLSDVSRLEVELCPKNLRNVEYLLSLCAQSLRHLNFSPRGASVSIRHLSALRVLQPKLDISHYITNVQFMESVSSGLLGTLESLYIPRDDNSNDQDHGSQTEVHQYCRLEEIDIPMGTPTYSQAVPQTFWTDLDDILVKLSPVRVRIVTTSLYQYREHLPNLRELLPNLGKSGRLMLTNEFWGSRLNEQGGKQFGRVAVERVC
ncbi:hypothetical protein BDN72DRAFT_965478 [Pluteus cervinus]|uniref:Uncharacterized protein n=1 Tax=Pluteus cervinus TaxID=181527 RepID=A0ACD3A5F1_9AGAR|nr:hypothetical protein BDN72DRAFT_965478 [Pluteus cervinus]